MSLDTSLYTALQAGTALAALVGTRTYPILAPQDAALPFVTWQEITSHPEATHDDIGATGFATVQFSAWGATISAARSVRAAVLAALQAATTLQCVAVGGTMTLDPITGRYGAMIDVSIWTTL